MLLYTGSIPRSVFMHFLHENHEFCRRQNQFIDFVCINCYWNEVRVNSNEIRLKESQDELVTLNFYSNVGYNSVNKLHFYTMRRWWKD